MAHSELDYPYPIDGLAYGFVDQCKGPTTVLRVAGDGSVLLDLINEE
jgi:hypothetical protein